MFKSTGQIKPVTPITITAKTNGEATVRIQETDYTIKDLAKFQVDPELANMKAAYSEIHKNATSPDSDYSKLLAVKNALIELKKQVDNFKVTEAKVGRRFVGIGVGGGITDEQAGKANLAAKGNVAAAVTEVKTKLNQNPIIKTQMEAVDTVMLIDDYNNFNTALKELASDKTGKIIEAMTIIDDALDKATATSKTLPNVAATNNSVQEDNKAAIAELEEFAEPGKNPAATPDARLEVELNGSAAQGGEAINTSDTVTDAERGGAANNTPVTGADNGPLNGGKRRRKTHKRKRAQNRKGRRTMNRRWH